MEGLITRGLWLLTFLLGCGQLSAFNLDTKNVLRRNGDPGSLFGFSLAMHRQLSPVDKTILLIGAPRAKALNGQRSKVTGGLYSCDMSSTTKACTRVIFDNQETEEDIKENQWMGVTVNSQGPGGKVVTCAHRYQNVNPSANTRAIIGRCYVLGQDLTIDTTSPEEGDNWHFCKGRNIGHELFGSCQQGLSAVFDKDYHYLIFGAPGAYNWKGEVHMEQRNDTLYSMGIYFDGPFETADEKKLNPDLVPVPTNSYLGFSLDSGKSLTKKGQLTVVAGAPRANHSGAVVLLKKGGDLTNILVKEFILEGEGLASSFGYDLAVLDFNKDGWEDIVVGAPQYFEKDGEIGGAVYIYINKAGKWNKVTPTRIDGPKDSMFGLAVENLGDINQDGYQDFAVGAPYDGDGMGKVYIYHGSNTDLKSLKAAQELRGKDVGVKLYGYSLAGNMDLDRNSYPDLAVGSLSDAVFVYRAQPVIKIEKKVTFSPSKIDLSTKNCGNSFCLTVEACFSYTAQPQSYGPRITVAYTLKADADRREKGLLPRARFTEASDSDNNYESKGKISMDTKGKEQCIRRKLAMQENIRDKLRAIPIDVSVAIEETKRKRRQTPAPQLPPVLDAKDEIPTREEVHFMKEGCEGNVCHSKLQMKYRYGFRTVDDEKFTPFELEKGVPLILLSNQKEIALEVTVTNLNGDDAHEASLIALLPRSLTYSGFRVSPDVKPVKCTANKDGSEAQCELGNPFKRDSETTFYIIMGTVGISRSSSELEVDLQIETTSEQQKQAIKAKAKVAIMLQLSLLGQAQPSQVYFSGKVKDESNMNTVSDVGSPVMHQFNILNLGKSLTDLGAVTLKIDWPKMTEKNDWLLYLVAINSSGIDHMDCTPEEINPRNLELKTRRRRAAENTLGDIEATFSRLEKVSKTLSCESGAKCVRIECHLTGLDSNAIITLTSRLWNSTFIQEYSKTHVEIKVKASLHVDSKTKSVVLQSAVTEARLTAFPERRAAQFGGVPWWIILLSILFGLLLLALLAFLLWKCGVFEKKNKEDTSEKEKLTSNA
ncbi:integrin alpha-6-like [Odontesthes bonariensis]|uniref:integrin alpha-6-like n=1 Tax=Odontesthes bonariensis TaxID=219752 RepID=UPI003F58113A